MIKRSFVILTILILTSQNILAEDSIMTRLIFYRESKLYGASVEYPVYLNDSEIFKISNNSVFEYPCPADIYSIHLQEKNDLTIRKYFEQGKTYYFKVEILGSIWKPNPILVEMDSSIAVQEISMGVYNPSSSESAKLFQSKNSLGLNLGFGAGLNPISLVVLTTGDEASISFGGGYTIGLWYAYRFNKKADLTVEFDYQVSSLTPEVSNATVSFRRVNIWATPSVIIPLNRSEMMNLKLGAGLNYNFSPTFTFDLSQLGSGSDTWKYKEVLGFHAQLSLEIHYSKIFSMYLGLRYVSVNYEFKSGGISYPNDIELQKPDGSAIDLMMGMAFHF